MILNNAHAPAAEFILIPIIRYENPLFLPGISTCGAIFNRGLETLNVTSSFQYCFVYKRGSTQIEGSFRASVPLSTAFLFCFYQVKRHVPRLLLVYYKLTTVFYSLGKKLSSPRTREPEFTGEFGVLLATKSLWTSCSSCIHFVKP